MQKFIYIIIFYAIIANAVSQELLFSDDFSDSESGWETFIDEDGSVAYEDGWLCIRDTSNEGKTTRSCFNEQFSDFVLDVDTKMIEGSDDNWHVVYCRFDSLDNNYGFGISADGYYAMDKWVDGERSLFIEPTESPYINIGKNVANHVHIECVGQDLSFSINGHLLIRAIDSSHEVGAICLASRALTGNFTKIAYDNFVLTEPE